MRVLVLGAGVVGVTAAWYLANDGHEVTVIDRQPFNGPTIVRMGDGTTRVVGQELALLLFCRPSDGE